MEGGLYISEMVNSNTLHTQTDINMEHPCYMFDGTPIMECILYTEIGNVNGCFENLSWEECEYGKCAYIGIEKEGDDSMGNSTYQRR